MKDTRYASVPELLIGRFPHNAMSNSHHADLLFDDYRRRVRKRLLVLFDERVED
jgi:hypothetical protein